MNRTQAVAKLKSYAGAIKALGATSLFLFGSKARNENTANSDLDLFVDYDPNGKFNVLDLVDIKFLLEDSLERNVMDLACSRWCLQSHRTERYS